MEKRKGPGRPKCPPNTLTPRELEIMNLLTTEHTYESMGKALFVSVHTIKAHITHIYEKLGVHDRRQAITKGIQRGFIACPYCAHTEEVRQWAH